MPRRRLLNERTTVTLKLPATMPALIAARCKELGFIHDEYINFLLDKNYYISHVITVEMINKAKNPEYKRNLMIVYLHNTGFTYETIAQALNLAPALPQYYCERFAKRGVPVLVPVRKIELAFFGFAVETATKKRLAEIAKRHGYTISRWLRFMIETDI